MLETVAPGIPLPAPDTQPGAKAGDSDRWYGSLLSLFSPAEAHAQAQPAPSDPAATGTPQVDNEKIQQLLQQLKTLQAEEQQALETIEQAPPPPPTEKPNNLSAPQDIEPKIWKKW